MVELISILLISCMLALDLVEFLLLVFIVIIIILSNHHLRTEAFHFSAETEIRIKSLTDFLVCETWANYKIIYIPYYYKAQRWGMQCVRSRNDVIATMTVTLQCCYDVTVAAAVADERIMLYPTMEGRGTSAIFIKLQFPSVAKFHVGFISSYSQCCIWHYLFVFAGFLCTCLKTLRC